MSPPTASGWIVAVLAMVLTVATANYLMQFTIGPWMTWGTPVIAFSFLITELTNRFYGPVVARRVVVAGFLMAWAVSMCLAPKRIATASASAFLLAQWLDIFVFSGLRRQGAWWLAPFVGSVCASFLDTFAFFYLAFAGTGVVWWQLGTGDLLCKLALDIGMLLPFRLAIRRRSRAA